MNKNLKYLQNIFLLLMMGFSLCAVQACSDDDDESNVLENGNLLVDGHEAVDLGLSVKWATCNVGASLPEDYGGYFAWGETKEKSDYSIDTYKWYDSEKYDLTKYNDDKDGKTVLDPSDDVATVKWGKKWRMPTKEEFEELVDECVWEKTTLNGVNGRLVTGPNGNSIFLPATGCRRETDIKYRGGYAQYWSATFSFWELAYELTYDNGAKDGYYLWDDECYYGNPVRPVTDESLFNIE